MSILLLVAALATPAPEKRCGWLVNPTPGNWWLIDRQGEWTISTQGGEEAEGMERIPATPASQFVKTNGNYGHSCACMTVDTVRGREKRIIRIRAATSRPLKVCRADRRLPRP